MRHRQIFHHIHPTNHADWTSSHLVQFTWYVRAPSCSRIVRNEEIRQSECSLCAFGHLHTTCTPRVCSVYMQTHLHSFDDVLSTTWTTQKAAERVQIDPPCLGACDYGLSGSETELEFRALHRGHVFICVMSFLLWGAYRVLDWWFKSSSYLSGPEMNSTAFSRRVQRDEAKTDGNIREVVVHSWPWRDVEKQKPVPGLLGKRVSAVCKKCIHSPTAPVCP